MNVNVSKLIERIHNRLPDVSVDTLRAISDVLEQELADCIITKQTYELAPVNNNDRLLNEYIVSMKLANKSPNTIKQYVSAVKGMLAYINKEVKDITHRDLKLYYIYYTQSHNISSTTLCNMQRYISPFFRFLVKEQYVLSNPADFVEVPKIKEPNIDAITQEEIEIIRNAASGSKRYALRNRALIEFLLATGCRVGEVVGCKVSDIDFVNKTVIVTGKGNKTRTVFFNGTASKHLKDYLKSRSDNVDILFLSKCKTQWSKNGIEEYCRKLESLTGIHCNPHRFRHTYAQICIDRGMNLEDLSKLLGHEEVSTTMRYFKINNNRIESAYKKFVS